MQKLLVIYMIHSQGFAGDDFNDVPYNTFRDAYGDNDCKMQYDDGDYDNYIYAQIWYRDKDGNRFWIDADVDYDD